MGRWENTSYGVSLSKLPIFLNFCYILFLIDHKVVLEQIFISIEQISVLYNRDSDFITVQTKIEAKILIFSLTPRLLISFFIFFLFV